MERRPRSEVGRDIITGRQQALSAWPPAASMQAGRPHARRVI